MPLTISGSAIGPWSSSYGGGYTYTGTQRQNGDPSYVKLDGGLILQFGTCYTGSNYSRTGNYISFPISFPNALIGLSMNERGAFGWGSGTGSTGACTIYVTTQATANGFYWRAAWMTQELNYYSSGLGGCWMAVGY